MKFPTAFLAPLVLTPLAAAQCEIARPGSDLQNFYISATSFSQNLVSIAGNGNLVQLYEPGPNGWTNTQTLAAPGFYLFESPNVHTDGQRVLIGMVEDGPGLNAEGRVYLYDAQDGFTNPIQLKASSAAGLDTFGSGMAIDQSVLVVGASDDRTGRAVRTGQEPVLRVRRHELGRGRRVQPARPDERDGRLRLPHRHGRCDRGDRRSPRRRHREVRWRRLHLRARSGERLERDGQALHRHADDGRGVRSRCRHRRGHALRRRAGPRRGFGLRLRAATGRLAGAAGPEAEERPRRRPLRLFAVARRQAPGHRRRGHRHPGRAVGRGRSTRSSARTASGRRSRRSSRTTPR